jgi:hypothetical protein
MAGAWMLQCLFCAIHLQIVVLTRQAVSALTTARMQAGSHLRWSEQTLAHRFRSYSKVKAGFVGPWREGREAMKSQLFRLLQKRGFRLFFRYRICEPPSEPAYLERWLLEQVDYAGNERNNGGYRQLLLPEGLRPLHSLPSHVCL